MKDVRNLDVFLEALGIGEVLVAEVAQLLGVPKRNLFKQKFFNVTGAH